MQRKEFLLTSGMLLTTAMLASYAMPRHGESDEVEDVQKVRRPNPDDFNEPVLKAITIGMNAPNPHNTQAWKFKIVSAYETLLYVDEKKILPATDPPARQIHIGCGSFIAIFKMGAASLGYDTEVEYLPDGEYAHHEIGNKPVAKLKLILRGVSSDPLYKHVYHRQTNRGIYFGELITETEFKEILRRANANHCQLKLHNDPSELPSLLEILFKGMEVECHDRKAYDESRQWFRVKSDIEEKRDGINLRTNGMKGLKRWIAETVLSNYSEKVWHNESNISTYLKNYHEVVLSSKGVVTFLTERNQQMDWLKCGEDFARFQMAAYDLGFVIQPLSQVLQEFESMKTLREEFTKRMLVADPAKIQMVVRIGRGNPMEYSYRKQTKYLLIESK
ncbi:MAG: Acg family FMN-binding oxidoreductase [Cyclobacteriaceae bacterium]